MFEKVLGDQITEHFITNKLFNENQHGFRKFHSCETAIHELVSKCLENLDKNKSICYIY